jgi:hypothetical protein
MHHPACWVKNGGCATNTTHQSVPVALGYPAERPVGGQAPHPGEGTRLLVDDDMEAGDEAPELLSVGSRERRENEPVIGAPPPQMRVVPGPGGGAPPRKPPVTSRAYAVDRAGKPMPKVYGRSRLLRYWYVPVAALVAVGVALGVIWVAGLFDDGDGDAASGDPTAAPTAAASETAGTETASPTSAPTGGKFEINDSVVITGVGAGGPGEPPCLNVRTEPGVDKPAVDCLPEGTQLTVLDGPQEAGGLVWWFVKTPSGDLWAAEEYLTKQ